MLKTAILFLVGVSVSVQAIVVQDYTAAEAPPAGLDWSYVYNYKGSSGVAVGDYWILTAAHVADDGGAGSLSIGGITYIQQEIIYHPLVGGYPPDLALVRYDKVLPGHYSLYTGSLLNLPVLMVGYGNTGTVSTASWTDSGAGRGTKRWGSQKIDRTYIKSLPGGPVGLRKTAGFEMDFDLGNTANEAGVGSGDSGGGVFYNDGGIWKLAGIIIGRDDAMFAAAMPWYNGWVMETIPEPATMCLMGFGTISLFLSRAERRRKLYGRSVLPIGRKRKPMCDLFIVTEGDEAEIAECPTSLAELKPSFHVALFPAWMESISSRFEGLNKDLWKYIVLAYERGEFRLDAIKSALVNDTVRGIDAFLDKVAWDKMVSTCGARRKSIQSALKRSAIKGLDKFLDMIYWDKI